MPETRVTIRFGRHPALDHLDPSTAFLYAPHTVSALVLGLVLLAYYGGVFSSGRPIDPAMNGSAVSNASAGLWAAIAIFLGYSVVQGPRTSMVRPHPAVWRLVHGVAMVYVQLLVWTLFQTVDDARQALKYLDPSLGVPIDYRDYGTSCHLFDSSTRMINWSALRSTVFDEFVLAHSLGWWAKALIIRNTGLLWATSIGFELMELTFAHMLPNFNECWWDSWLLDVAICNSLGIYFGMATVRWFECKYTNYNWQGWSQLRGLKERATRSVQQLLPYSWTKLDWMVSSSPARCLQSLLVVAAFLTVELNVFFLKYALWLPPTNPLNTLRLLLWLLVGAPAVREYYEFLEGSSGSQVLAGGFRFYKLGMFAWLAIAMLSLETMISIKFGRGLYHNPWPRSVLISWSLGGTLFALVLAVWQLRLQRSTSGRSRNRSNSSRRGNACSRPMPAKAVEQQQQQKVQRGPAADGGVNRLKEDCRKGQKTL